MSKYIRYQSLIVWGMMILVAIQLIYFASGFGFMHALLFILFLLNIDIYEAKDRDAFRDWITYGLIFLSTIILMLETRLGSYTGYFYYLLLGLTAVSLIPFIWRFKTIYENQEIHKINKRNKKMFEKRSKFIPIYSYILIGVVGSIAVASIYFLFTL